MFYDFQKLLTEKLEEVIDDEDVDSSLSEVFLFSFKAITLDDTPINREEVAEVLTTIIEYSNDGSNEPNTYVDFVPHDDGNGRVEVTFMDGSGVDIIFEEERIFLFRAIPDPAKSGIPLSDSIN